MHAANRIVRQPLNEGPATDAPPWLRIGFWTCTVIAIAVVLRRVSALIHPLQAGPPPMVQLDRVFSGHAVLTLAHILPALAFVVLTPFAFARRFAKQTWPERWLFPLGAWVGISAYAMSAYSVGGWIERSAVLFYDSLFLYSLARAWSYRQRGQNALKTQWLRRAVGVLLGIATTRPVMGVFFATSRITHLVPRQFFGVAFWIGFSINWLVIEWWIRHQQRAPAFERAVAG